MGGVFDSLTDAMREAMEERRGRLKAEAKLDRALKLLATFEYGTTGACLNCAIMAGHGHTRTCEVGLLLGRDKDRGDQ